MYGNSGPNPTREAAGISAAKDEMLYTFDFFSSGSGGSRFFFPT
jgi:hypothetical protein